MGRYFIAATIAALLVASCSDPAVTSKGEGAHTVKLPEPMLDGGLSVERALQARRSVREFAAGSLSLAQVSQLLWAAQGINRPKGRRTAPSAGALYPLEIFLVAGSVDGLAPAVYLYLPATHELLLKKTGDRRAALANAALGQDWIAGAPVVIVIAAVYQRTTKKYGQRGRSYVDIEAGHAGQNLHLQAVSLGLGSVTIGAFDDDELKTLLGMHEDVEPIAITPVGWEAKTAAKT